MLLDFKAMLGGHRILNGFQFGREEFYDLATLHADHVVVMLVLVIVLVVRASVAEAHLARQPGFGQKLERAIDCGLPYAGVFRLHQPVEVFAGQVLFGTQKDFQYQVALRRPLQPCLLDVLEKYFLLFTHKVSGSIKKTSVEALVVKVF